MEITQLIAQITKDIGNGRVIFLNFIDFYLGNFLIINLSTSARKGNSDMVSSI